MKNCTLLAAALSSNYLSTTPFNPGVDLPEYLASNGVLLTMCIDRPDFSCDIGKSDHVSASWINSDLGLRVIPAPVGLVLDPRAAEVRCLFPTDAGTDGRDDAGCGPVSDDPEYGSRGASHLGPIRRWFVRREVDWYTRSRFGANSTWRDVPCERFYQVPGFAMGTVWRSSGDCEAMKAGRGELRYDSFLDGLASRLTPFLGHPPCAVDNPAANFSKEHWWEYGGECAWQPHQWQEMVNAMHHRFIPKGPEMFLWNEIVFAKPTMMETIVSAVFFILTPNMDMDTRSKIRRMAMQEAIALGDKPILEVDIASLAAGQPLFSCVLSKADWPESDGLDSESIDVSSRLRKV